MVDGDKNNEQATDGQTNRRRFLQTAAGVGVGSVIGANQVGRARATKAETQWTFDTGDRVASSPTVVDETVYVGSWDNTVYAVDADDGTTAWTFETDQSIDSSPTVVNGTVYIGSYDRHVYALAADSGTQQWRFETDDWVQSSPTVKDGIVYVGGRDNTVYALDADTGEKRWTFETGGRVLSSPTVVNGTVFIGSYDNTVYALDATSGTTEWTFETDGSVHASPTVMDDTVFVGSGDGNVYAIETASGEEAWRVTTGGGIQSSPTVAYGTVFVGSKDANVYALDAATGERQWKTAAGDIRWSSPTVADGTVIVGSRDTSVYALQADTGEIDWSFQTNWLVNSSPTVVNGTAFIGSYDGTLYALDAGVDGSSEDSRVNLGTLGHHHKWADRSEPDPGLSIEKSTGVATLEEEITFIAENAEGTVSWDLGEGTEMTGTEITHSYDIPGEYEVTATDGQTDETASTTVSVAEGLDFSYEPESPTTEDTITFTGNDFYEWDFGDGTETIGTEVLHSYDEPDEYTVTASSLTEDESTTKEITVSEDVIEITDLSVSPDSVMEGIDVDVWFEAVVETDDNHNPGEVYVEIDDQRVNLSPDTPPIPSNRYNGSISTTDLNLDTGPNDARIVAETGDGNSTERTVTLLRTEPGPNLDEFFDTPDTLGNLVTFGQEFIDFDFEFGSDANLLPDNLPLKSKTLIAVVAHLSADGTHNLETGDVTVESESALGANILGTGLEMQAGITAESSHDSYIRDFVLTEFYLAGTGSPRSGPKMKFKMPSKWFLPDLGEIELEFNVRPGGLFRVDDFDPLPGFDTRPIMPSDGIFDSYNHLLGAPTISVKGAQIKPFLDGYIHTAGDLEIEGVLAPPMGMPMIPEGGTAKINGGVDVGYEDWGFKVSVDTLATLTPGFDGLELSLGTTRDEPDWNVFAMDPPGKVPPGETAELLAEDTDPALIDPTGTQPAANPVSPETGVTSVSRLTDRGISDMNPGLTRQGDKHTLVWGAYRDGAPAKQGRDIAVRTHKSDGSWTDRTYLTDTDGIGYNKPAVAVTDARRAVVCTRTDLDAVEETADIPAQTDVSILVDDGSGWTSPVAVTDDDSDLLEHELSVAPLGTDQWVVAWERSSSITDDQPHVRYTIVDDAGQTVTTETIDTASDPRLAAVDNGVSIVYHDYGAGKITRETITESGRTQQASYDAANIKDLTATADATAWALADTDDPTIVYADGSSSAELDLADDIQSIQTLDLVETALGTALVYRRAGTGESLNAVSYRLKRDGGWHEERIFATPNTDQDPDDVTIWQPTVAPAIDGDGIMSVLASKPDATADTLDATVNDLFAVTQPFRPSYGLTATPAETDVEPGTDVTISYTLENLGDRPGSQPVTVEAQSNGTTLAEQTESALAPGDAVSGELTVTLDESGTVEVVAGSDLSLLSTPSTTLAISTPAVSFESLSAVRPDESTLEATVTVQNEGPIDADAFALELQASGKSVATGTIDGLPAGETATTTMTVDPAAISIGSTETLQIDPAGSLPDAHVVRATESVLVGRPELLVDEQITYFATKNGVEAEVVVQNSGELPATATIEVVSQEATADATGFSTGDVLGTKMIDLPAAVDGVAQAETVSILLSGVEEGDPIKLIAEPKRPIASPGIPSVNDKVGPIFDGEDPEDDDGDIPPVVGDKPPQDLNGDGLYRDVNGDGAVDIFDVQALFGKLDSDVVQNNPKAFNFSGDDNPEEVDIFDVQALFGDL